MNGLIRSSGVLMAIVLSTMSAFAQTPAAAASAVVDSKRLETSLLTKIKSGQMLAQSESKSVSVPKDSELAGFKCETLPKFSQTEGLDTVIRLMALKEVKKALGSEGSQITDEQLHALKSVRLDELAKHAVDQKVPMKIRSLSLLLIKRTAGNERPNLKLYLEKAKEARSLLWQRLSSDLKAHIIAEVGAQTGYGESAKLEIGDKNLLEDLDQASNDVKFRSRLKQTVLCFADLQLPDESMLTVLVPVKGSAVDSSRALLDVGASLAKLDAANILVPEQE